MLPGNRYNLAMPRLLFAGDWLYRLPKEEWNAHFEVLNRLDQRFGRPDGRSFDPITVTWKSNKRHRSAVETLAHYFRREFGYDFVQYQSEEVDTHCRCFLWDAGDWERTAIGACCFRWRVYSDGTSNWALAWVWFHPWERRKGHLSKAWPYFRERFGSFVVETPVSPPMQAFLKKHDAEVF